MSKKPTSRFVASVSVPRPLNTKEGKREHERQMEALKEGKSLIPDLANCETIEVIEKYVAYYRVSTQKQSIGLEAQKTMVQNYLKDIAPMATFQEKESGKCDKNRPELQKAMKLCKKEGATLIIATLSRLSRDLHFITSLEKSKIRFVCCDMPGANSLTINLIGAIAQYERETISNRTKLALAEVKRSGKPLGMNNPKIKAGIEKYWAKQKQTKLKKEAKPINPKARPKLIESKTYLADQKVVPVIKMLRKRNTTWQNIANELNEAGISPRIKGTWHRTSIKRVADRHSIV